MREAVHRRLLRVYRHLPTGLRRRAVRTVAPTFTVGAMCFVERDDGRLLLVRHEYRNRWGVPGGLLDRGEEPADAARREAREEVGLAIVLVGEPQVVVDPEPRRVDIIFEARVAPGADPDEVAPGSPEIVECRWFDPTDLPELQHETVSALVARSRVRAGEGG